jgi:hypothetical protein
MMLSSRAMQMIFSRVFIQINITAVQATITLALTLLTWRVTNAVRHRLPVGRAMV